MPANFPPVKHNGWKGACGRTSAGSLERMVQVRDGGRGARCLVPFTAGKSRVPSARPSRFMRERTFCPGSSARLCRLVRQELRRHRPGRGLYAVVFDVMVESVPPPLWIQASLGRGRSPAARPDRSCAGRRRVSGALSSLSARASAPPRSRSLLPEDAGSV